MFSLKNNTINQKLYYEVLAQNRSYENFQTLSKNGVINFMHNTYWQFKEINFLSSVDQNKFIFLLLLSFYYATNSHIFTTISHF